MSDEFQKINSDNLLYVVTSRGAIDAEKGCAILQLSVAKTAAALSTPDQLLFSIHPEVALKIISSLQASLARLQSIQ